MTLHEMVDKYRAAANGFGVPVPLAAFGLTREQTVRLFGFLDEDYHISRFLHFSLDPELEKYAGQTYPINGFKQSHIALDAEIVESL